MKKITDAIIINETPSAKPKVIAIGSGKGGVGKSTIASNLAISLSKLGNGNKVGLIDADIYGPTQSKMLGQEQTMAQLDIFNKILPIAAYGIKFISINSIIDSNKPLILRAPIANKIIHQLLNNISWGELDYLLIDLPPGTGDIQLTIAQNAKLDGSIIVTTPQDIAINIAKKGLDMFVKLNVPIIGIIENMSGFNCSHCGKSNEIFQTDHMQTFMQQYNIPIIGKIPLHPDIAYAGDHGVPLTNSTDPTEYELAKIFNKIASTVVTTLQTPEQINNNQNLEPDALDIQNGKLHIIWQAKKISKIIEPYQLRLQCKCALCINENTGKSMLQSEKIDKNIIISKIESIGRYGIKITFSDHHSSGIFLFENLIKL